MRAPSTPSPTARRHGRLHLHQPRSQPRVVVEALVDVGVIGSSAARQLCWAHLARAFQALVDDGGEQARGGQLLLMTAQEVLHGWNEYRQRKCRDEIEPLLRRGRADLNWSLSKYIALPGLRTPAHAFVSSDSMWLLTKREDVEPTNNLAERDLQPLVM